MKVRLALFWLTLIVTLGVVNWFVYQRESVVASGVRVLLPLAPRDPRSLIQGDYMLLNYQLLTNLRMFDPGQSGKVVLWVDPKTQIGSFQHIQDSAESIQPPYLSLNFIRKSDGSFTLGAESFFFQEGQADLYAQAAYAELRVTPDGDNVLVALYDADLKLLGEIK